ncbi:hypothetical protein B0T10DRAFT_197715 [Thelonectria olida]|uniref:CFEM domain-containing protein n=1 Tax=Thelonectria olida TaxID=1576542 RepID=A0A9P8VT67_9HYPO|nr:hypothetical protein B0T10DRAFT_197715 [Thelonectria olida]
MRTSTLVIATIVSCLVAAKVELKDYFPECSIDCLETGTEKATDCELDDAVCWCVQSNYEAIYNQALNCVMEECGADKAIESVLPAAIVFCSAASSSTSALGHQATGTSSGSTKTNTAVTASITSGADSTPTASSGSESSASVSGAAATTTSSDSGAVAIGSMGAFGMLVLGIAAAL